MLYQWADGLARQLKSIFKQLNLGGLALHKGERHINLEEHLKAEIKKYRLWAFLESHGSREGRYSSGYLQALEDVLSKLKECEQLTLF
ncbi:hypothetical protein ACL9RM_25155 [Paenibacillus sp. S29]